MQRDYQLMSVSRDGKCVKIRRNGYEQWYRIFMDGEQPCIRIGEHVYLVIDVKVTRLNPTSHGAKCSN